VLESIWGIENKSVSTRTVDTHVSRLRKKLSLGEENGWKLSAIYQHGYRIERTNA
jgi:DNA-binding response OmpR family regulator